MTALNCAGLVLDGFAVAGLPAWVAGLYSSVLDPLIFFALIALTLSPYIAFWPIASVAPRMRPIAILCMLWTAADLLWFLLEITAIPVPGIPNLYARWGLTLHNTRGIITALVVAALFALLFREQRQISLDRATLAGELQAAGEIQRLLAPAKIDTAPGLQIEVAFRTMREVGGDFYLTYAACCPMDISASCSATSAAKVRLPPWRRLCCWALPKNAIATPQSNCSPT